jgi:hypothetical protein
MKVTCPRCNGTGSVPQFKHVQDGVCFRCDGSGLSYPDKPQPVNLELVSDIFTLVLIKGDITYYAQAYVWNTEPRAERYGKGHFFSRAVVRGAKWSSPLMDVEKNLYEAPLDEVRAKYREYLAKGYKLLPNEEHQQWFEENVEFFADRG